MDHLNKSLFLSINAGPHPSQFLLLAARFFASFLVPLAILLFVLLWIRKPDRRSRAALVSATITMLLGLAINQIIGLFYFHPRPFMIGLGYQYLSHPPDNSFPSDHATFLWSLAFALLVLGAFRFWAVLLLAAGIAVAWARVFLGIHFPFDMSGSLLVALLAMSFTSVIHRLVKPWLTPSCTSLYENGIRFCRLPPILFPRQRDINQS